MPVPLHSALSQQWLDLTPTKFQFSWTHALKEDPNHVTETHPGSFMEGMEGWGAAMGLRDTSHLQPNVWSLRQENGKFKVN